MSAGDKLPPKRKKFAEKLVTTAQWNGAEAYRQAGYSAPSITCASTGAHKLVTDGDVTDYIDELVRDSGIADKLNPKVIKAGIYKAFETAKAKDDVGNMLRAWEMLGRAHAMFKDVQRTEDATTDDLLNAIKGLVPDETLAVIAEEQGVDPESLGISRH